MTETKSLLQKKPLNILVANWVWYRHAGDWTYMENVNRLYQQLGHNIIPFSMKSEKNLETNGFDKYFVDFIDYKILNKDINLSNGFRAISKTVYSNEAARNLEKLLKACKVDIAHLHNIHHYITPSILPVLKKRNIPIVWTLHDYTLICPENSFVSHGSICEKCKGGRFVACALNKCKKDSFLASSLAALENYVHRYAHLLNHVDYFLCPSEFLYNKFYEFNFFREKLITTNYCFDANKNIESAYIPETEKYILYVGRLEKIKGVITLLKAVKGLDIKLYIAGTGGLKDEIKNFVTDNDIKTVTFLGHKTRNEVYDLIRSAQFTVCPSEWYENYPFSIIEAMFFKKAIIGARIGGIPELLIEGETGMLFEPFNVDDLREKIVKLWSDNDLKLKLGENAFNFISNQVSYSRHFDILSSIFKKVNIDL